MVIINVTRRALQGAALLDAQHPGWTGQVSLRDLDISSAHACVLGQLYGGYHEGCRSLGLEDATKATAVNYGFIAGYGRARGLQFTLLTAIWIIITGWRRLRAGNIGKEIPEKNREYEPFPAEAPAEPEGEPAVPVTEPEKVPA